MPLPLFTNRTMQESPRLPPPRYVLKGERRSQRNVIIAMGFAYRLERIDVDEILLLANLPPLGRSVLREFRRANASVGSL